MTAKIRYIALKDVMDVAAVYALLDGITASPWTERGTAHLLREAKAKVDEKAIEWALCNSSRIAADCIESEIRARVAAEVDDAKWEMEGRMQAQRQSAVEAAVAKLNKEKQGESK